MSFGKPAAEKPAPELLGIDKSQQPTNQEAVILPYVAGQYVVPAHWFSPVYNEFAREAPTQRPSKK